MNVRKLALVGVAGLGLGAGACVDNGADSGMRIIGNVVPGDGCSVDGAGTTLQDDGFIEPSAVFGYVFTPGVRNDLVTTPDEAIGPKTIYITHARVNVSFYDPEFTADASLLEFQVPVSGVIEPNGGVSGFSFEIVPPELLAAVGAQLPAPTESNPLPRTTLGVSIQMVGTRGGGEVVSNTYQYPVTVCDGCSYNFLGSCTTDVPMGYDASTGGVCNAVQDGVVDCCTNTLVTPNTTVCPAVHIDPPDPPA